MAENQVYQLKITLQNTKPPIWRRVQVPCDWNFKSLHRAIQDAMGWRNCHLYFFEALNQKTNKKERIEPNDNMFDGGIPDDKAAIKDYLSKPKDKIYYEYDMGDSWGHVLTLEEILPQDKQMKYPKCLCGRRACPPEDCGGIWGYNDLLEILNDPNHPEHSEYRSWIQKTTGSQAFRPEHFEASNVFEHWESD